MKVSRKSELWEQFFSVIVIVGILVTIHPALCLIVAYASSTSSVLTSPHLGPMPQSWHNVIEFLHV